MAFFQHKPRRHLIPLHHDNAEKNDWLIILEANTIVGRNRERLRVACATRERRVVKRIRSFKLQPFLSLEYYDPRIHVLFFCPQLYQYDEDGVLIPLQSDEIGRFIARALDDKSAVRRPWYGPMESLPDGPLVTGPMVDDYDTLVVESPRIQPLLPAPIEAAAVSAKVKQPA